MQGQMIMDLKYHCFILSDCFNLGISQTLECNPFIRYCNEQDSSNSYT